MLENSFVLLHVLSQLNVYPEHADSSSSRVRSRVGRGMLFVMLPNSSKGDPMTNAVAPQVAVCPQYRLLLDQCQKALVAWQQQRTRVERASFIDKRLARDLIQLRQNYARAHAQVDSHEQSCATCQYVAKIAGLDFESMSSALNRKSRSS
jgi:hypothetical protein